MSCVWRGEVLQDEGTVGAVGQFSFWGGAGCSSWVGA